ncbi:MAG TPA: helix-turn-helix domain-containing protein [Pyrinomonadaceae bacterium]|nr:helix-turn-helix domain-containing protein [Pyrinomonadaceae bacterium]
METKSSSDIYDDSCLHLEHKRFYVSVKGKPLALTRTEFRVLSRLVKGINCIVQFEDLWAHAWGPGKPFNLKSIHVFVSRVRRKLVLFGVRVDSVVGVGYILSHGSCCKTDLQQANVQINANQA